jgi:tetratricopeptide (TPR) repeat protein
MDPNPSPAEKQYVSANQVIKGVLEHLREGRHEEAVSLYSHCQEDVGYLLLSRCPRERPLQLRLAKMFFGSKDYEKSALMLESMGEFQKAAELYEKTDQYAQAAEMWAKSNDLGRAAHMYEKAGVWPSAADLYTRAQQFERAAYCFEKAMNHFLAGKYYFQIRKFQKSMELLQKVEAAEEHYLESAAIIGNILAMHGHMDLAIAKYKAVTKTVALQKGTVSLFYNLAQLLERRGDLFEAVKLYQEIAGVDPAFRDAAARAQKLDQDLAGKVETVDAAGREDAEVIEDLEPVEEEVVAPAGPHPSATPARIVSVMEGFEFLKNTSLFEGLALAEMKRLWNACETRRFSPGEILIEQDQPGQSLFVVKKGKVSVQRVEGGQTTTLVELGPGAHVGEMSLVDQAPTSARVAAAAEGAEAFEITRAKFEELLETDDKIAIKVYKVFIQTLCGRLRKTSAELSALKAGPA